MGIKNFKVNFILILPNSLKDILPFKMPVRYKGIFSQLTMNLILCGFQTHL